MKGQRKSRRRLILSIREAIALLREEQSKEYHEPRRDLLPAMDLLIDNLVELERESDND
jgi:hypothetical protein